MNETVKIIFGLLGGLAVFIYGMNMMSECLQKAAGEKMKAILAMLTKNPVLGVLAGALTTAVLQSSSATTVMVIGFVSAGLMSLPQAISIILGANIGTTMTAQIIAFKISDYIYLIIFAGFILSFVCKKEKVKNIGQTIFAFGLLFLGIETMGSVMKPLASSPFFVDMIGKVAHIPVLGVAVGALMTLVVQSSSATIAVLQNFASQAGPDGVTSIIGLAGAIPILLGDNIGTTITAVLASIGQSKDARRTAFAHCVFNISGAILFLFLVKPYAALIQFISPKGNEVDVISRQIANAHTGFNLTMTLIWIPLIPVMVKIVMKLVPEKTSVTEIAMGQPMYLDTKLISQPVAAMQLVAKETLRCADIVEEMFVNLHECIDKNGKNIENELEESAQTLQKLYVSINDYLASMYSEGVLTEEQASQSAGVLYVLCDIDRIGILLNEIVNTISVENKSKHKYSKDALKELRKAMAQIHEIYTASIRAISGDGSMDIEALQKQKDEVMALDERLRKNHITRVGKGKCDSKLTAQYNEMTGLSGLEKRYPNQLSGGQRQRVAFARALAPNPQVLLLDEPFAAIDAKVRGELRTWLKELVEKLGITSIFVTHDQDEAVEVADEIIITNHGTIEQMGTPLEIYKSPDTPFVAQFIGHTTVVENYDRLKGFDRIENADKAVIRPEFIKISKSGNLDRYQSAAEEGIVTDVVFRGNRMDITVSINGIEVVGERSLEKDLIAVGEKVHVLIYRLYIFDEEKTYLMENSEMQEQDVFYI